MGEGRKFCWHRKRLCPWAMFDEACLHTVGDTELPCEPRSVAARRAVFDSAIAPFLTADAAKVAAQ